ncbi:ribosomal protection-like ABC-F family protein [Marinilactibacillus sp. Marseille-P9653]|uniref:ribosomal protection-like ABC-F family protein n=1 Tax=Marinilactibacillus sp. Marseille-P9653 TaxID=2866583 RepID=UPI001CE4B14A|nr:ABC-F family ATP-binding cassette domain-containing protein [Marinilactibacillus sp. Marseille-P9653]
MIICNVNSISQQYGGTTIFENVSLEIKQGEKIGLVGRNGSGKTTLMKLLAQVETQTSGNIHWKKGCSIGYLEQIPAYSDEMSVREVLKTVFEELLEKETEMKQLEMEMSQTENQNQLQKLIDQYGKVQEAYLQEGGYEIESRIHQVTQGLAINHLIDTSFNLLSGGEQTKVGLAMTLLIHPDLLLLDEPTNHLDFAATEWLEQFVSNYAGTVVIISHDRYFLDEAIQKVIDVEDGECTVYHTNFSNYVKEKEEKVAREFQIYEEQQRKIKKMKERAKILREWANRAVPPNPGLHKKARHMERMIERMEKVKKPLIHKQMNLDITASERSGKDVVVARAVTKSFGDRQILNESSMHIRFGEKIGLIGENGAGKSTLLKLLLKEETPDSGLIKIGENLKVGYLSQHLFTDKKDERLIDVFRESIQIEEGQSRHQLARFLFYGSDVFKSVSSLSGGEKMRLRLAQLMHEDINFLILDEPTNHLDIESRELVEETLDKFQGTVLAVSHDRFFLDQTFKKIFWIENQKVETFEGGYSWAKGKKAERLKKIE